jgi:uncharacterized protein Usg
MLVAKATALLTSWNGTTKWYSTFDKSIDGRRFCAAFDVTWNGDERMQFSSDLERQLNGYGLTTAHILYRIPDFESVLQTYVWQDYDLAPDFPEMHRFLDFWQSNLDGPLHSVRYTHQRLIGPNEWRRVNGELKLH